MATPFDDVDYTIWLDGSRESAAIVVPLVMEEIRPRSVVDVGCGLGAWVAAFSEHGVKDVLGIDGPWVDQELLEIPAGAFQVADLGEPIDSARRFDLANVRDAVCPIASSVAHQRLHSWAPRRDSHPGEEAIYVGGEEWIGQGS